MSAAPGSGQLPLALRYPPDQRFDTWVDMRPGTADAVRALADGALADGMLAEDMLADGTLANGTAAAPLYLAGPAGSGKSHLALAACAQAEARGVACAYVALARVAGHLRAALDGVDAMALVALDGLEHVAGNDGDELALFEVHNRMRDAGRALLYTASAPPDALPLRLPDLRSRLVQCTRIALVPLDDAARAQMLRLRAHRRGLQLDDASIDWLLRRVGRDPAGLAALFERLDRAALAAQRRITVPFLREVLG